MKSNKKYLRNKIVHSFLTDVRNVFNRFVILNLNYMTDNNIKKIHAN